MKAIDWPYGDNGRTDRQGSPSPDLRNIYDYLAQKKIDLVINLPLRQHKLVSMLHHIT